MSLLRKIWPKKRIFLDFASTTPIDKGVLKEMQKYQNNFENPSALYSGALSSKEIIKGARRKIADILNCVEEEIIFTSGGTEGNNLALLGVFEAQRKENFVPHFVVTEIEHPSVLEVCDEIEKRGGEVTKVGISHDGIVSVRDIISAIKENTILVSVMYANNEIGTLQPIKEIGRAIKELRRKNNSSTPYFHTDACQASQYLLLDVLKLNVDLLTLDGIKMYGPRSSGVLYVKRGLNIKPVIFGGGQEKGLRSGTENISAIVGMAKALTTANEMRESESERLTPIRDYGIEKILKEFKGASLNGERVQRLPNNINICFPGLDAEFAVISLDVLGFSVSYSSSCRNLKEDSSSYVVESLGKTDCKNSSLRFTLGRESRKKDIDQLIYALKKIVIS